MPTITADPATIPRIGPPPLDAVERPVRSITTAPAALEGEGFPVRRAFAGIPTSELDPFIHMDQMGEVDYAPGEPRGTDWHPHRVSFVSSPAPSVPTPVRVRHTPRSPSSTRRSRRARGSVFRGPSSSTRSPTRSPAPAPSASSARPSAPDSSPSSGVATPSPSPRTVPTRSTSTCSADSRSVNPWRSTAHS